MEADLETVGERLRDALEACTFEDSRGHERRCSVRWLGKQLSERYRELRGTAREALQGYFDGKTSPSIALLEATASILDVRTAWLATGEGMALRDAYVYTDRPLWLIDGVATPGGGGRLEEHWLPPEGNLEEIRDSFNKRFHRIGPSARTWSQVSPMIHVAFGNLFARVIESEKKKRGEFIEARARGGIAGGLLRELSQAARGLPNGAEGSRQYGGPVWTDSLIRVIGRRMMEHRIGAR